MNRPFVLENRTTWLEPATIVVISLIAVSCLIGKLNYPNSAQGARRLLETNKRRSGLRGDDAQSSTTTSHHPSGSAKHNRARDTSHGQDNITSMRNNKLSSVQSHPGHSHLIPRSRDSSVGLPGSRGNSLNLGSLQSRSLYGARRSHSPETLSRLSRSQSREVSQQRRIFSGGSNSQHVQLYVSNHTLAYYI